MVAIQLDRDMSYHTRTTCRRGSDGPLCTAILYLALFPALASALSWRISHQHRLGSFSCSLRRDVVEWLRATLLTGFAWDPLAAAWLESAWIAQGARWIGTYACQVWRYSPPVCSGLECSADAHHPRPDSRADGRCNYPRTVDGRRTGARGAGAIAFRIVQPESDRMKRMTSSRPTETRALCEAVRNAHSSAPIVTLAEGATLIFSILSPKGAIGALDTARTTRFTDAGGESVTLDLPAMMTCITTAYFALDKRLPSLALRQIATSSRWGILTVRRSWDA